MTRLTKLAGLTTGGVATDRRIAVPRLLGGKRLAGGSAGWLHAPTRRRY